MSSVDFVPARQQILAPVIGKRDAPTTSNDTLALIDSGIAEIRQQYHPGDHEDWLALSAGMKLRSLDAAAQARKNLGGDDGGAASITPQNAFRTALCVAYAAAMGGAIDGVAAAQGQGGPMVLPHGKVPDALNRTAAVELEQLLSGEVDTLSIPSFTAGLGARAGMAADARFTAGNVEWLMSSAYSYGFQHGAEGLSVNLRGVDNFDWKPAIA